MYIEISITNFFGMYYYHFINMAIIWACINLHTGEASCVLLKNVAIIDIFDNTIHIIEFIEIF